MLTLGTDVHLLWYKIFDLLFTCRLPYSKLVGGVFAISVDHFIQVNGYSGYFWGWGGEDDDMYKRYACVPRTNITI